MNLVKNWNFPLCLLFKIRLEIMFADHPVRKQALLPSRPMEIFSKGLTHEFS